MIDWSISRYEVPLILVNKHLHEKLPQSIHVNSSLTLLAMFQQDGCSCERVCQSGMLCLCSKRSERQRLWYEVCHQPFTNSHSLFGSYNPGEKSLGQCCNIYNFLSFLGSLLIQYILFEIFLRFSLPPPYKKLKLGKNSGYTRPTLFVGWGEGLDLCELENAPETQKCPKTLVHDCRSRNNF